MNLISLFDAKVNQQPQCQALIGFHKGKLASYSFAVLADKVNAMADTLQASGIKAGERVVLFTPINLELLVLLLAIFKLGATCVFIDPGFSLKQIYQCICDSRADHILACPQAFFLFRFFPPASCRVHNVACLFTRVQRSKVSLPVATAEVSDATPALITFTSGSTGSPKCLVRSHGFLMMQSQVLTLNLARKDRQLELTTLPIFVLNNLALGVPSLLASTKQPPAITIGVLKECKVSNILCAPAFLDTLATEMLRRCQSLPFVEEITVGGGPVFSGILERAGKAFPNAKLRIVYGSSEVEPISSFVVENLDHYSREAALGNGLLVGRAAQETEIVIGDSRYLNQYMSQLEFHKALLKTGCAGEILVAAKHGLGQYGDSVGGLAANKIAVDGKLYHRCGDAGYFDEKGLLHYLGPVKGRLNCASDSACFSGQIEAAFLAATEGALRAAVDTRQLTIYVEMARGYRLPRKLALWSLPAIFPHAFKVIVLNKIPVDRRHLSKVLYDKLPKENRLPVINSRSQIPSHSEKSHLS